MSTTKLKELYESPTTDVVEFKMENGILTVSNGTPENRQNGGNWGGGEEEVWY